ncbi:MAG: hypothetical protein KL787_02045 [Taibaiella sp.]|nr:hypothetical protein [Taibaiella sp.]
MNRFSTNDFNNSIQHTLNFGAGYTMFKYFNLSFSIPYTEYWNTKQFYTYYDTISNDIDSVINNGFYTSREFSFSASVNTRLYGMKMFKKGKIAGIRHVLTPGIGITYMPGFGRSPFKLFCVCQEVPVEPLRLCRPFIIHLMLLWAGPGMPIPWARSNFDLNNNLAIKIRGDDSTDAVNVNLIDRFTINTSYNLFADSNNLSNIVLALGSKIKDLVIINAGAAFDPYYWENGYRTRHYLYNVKNRPVDFQSGNISLGFSFQGAKQDQEEFDEEMENNEQLNRLMRNGGYEDYYDFNVPYDFHLSYSMSANRTFRQDRSSSFIFINHSVVFGGQMTLTEKLAGLHSNPGTTLPKNEMSTTSLNISREPALLADGIEPGAVWTLPFLQFYVECKEYRIAGFEADQAKIVFG